MNDDMITRHKLRLPLEFISILKLRNLYSFLLQNGMWLHWLYWPTTLVTLVLMCLSCLNAI